MQYLSERLDAEIRWRLVLVGGMANIRFKWIAVAVVGGRELAKRVGLAFGIFLAVVR